MKSFFQRKSKVSRFTGSPHKVCHAFSAEDIHDGQDKEEFLFAGDVAVLDVKLPDLIRSRDLSIESDDSPGDLPLPSLGQQKLVFFEYSRDLLVIDVEAMLLSKIFCELLCTPVIRKEPFVSILLAETGNDPVRENGSISIDGISRNRTAWRTSSRSFFWR